MEAFAVQKYGKNSPLEQIEIPKPKVGANDVLVEVHAASVNRLDGMLKNGEFKLLLPQKMPLILGNDVAGVVAEVGEEVTAFSVGDEVYSKPAINRIGTFAEYIAINEADIAHKPKNLSMEEAATIPLVGLTSWQALVERGEIKKGQKVFIQAGSGGVGTFAIQLAKRAGAFVATTAGANSAELVKELGADIVIDYRKDDFEEILNDYDIVLHSQGAEELEKSLRILKRGGKLISLSGPPTPEFASEVHAPAVAKLAIKALSRKTRSQAKKLGIDYSFLFMHASGKQLERLTKLIEAGKIRPIIDKVYPFAQTPEALEYVESKRAKGKVAISLRNAG